MKRYFAVVLLLVGCSQSHVQSGTPAERAAYRKAFFDDCMKALPTGPQVSHYSDWDEVVRECDQTAYYNTNERFP